MGVEDHPEVSVGNPPVIAKAFQAIVIDRHETAHARMPQRG